MKNTIRKKDLDMMKPEPDKFVCTVESNTSNPREYDVNSRNIVALANKYGRGECGETVTVTDRAGKTVSKAIWDISQKKYIRVTV